MNDIAAGKRKGKGKGKPEVEDIFLTMPTGRRGDGVY